MDNPPINLDKLSEPLTKLVEVVSKGIGTLYAPRGTVRQAKADGEAKIIHAQADAKALEIQERANERIRYRESLRQENIEKISNQAELELPGEVSSEMVDTDWTLQYFDHAQDVCDEDMQKLWARILAGEVAKPGSYSKRTLQFLKTLDKKEAEGFTHLCCASVTLSGRHYIFEEAATKKVLEEKFGLLDYKQHFLSIGLLTVDPYNVNPSDATGVEITYFDREFTLEGPDKPEPSRIPLIEQWFTLRGFTSIGEQLASIAGAMPIDGYIDRLAEGCKDRYSILFCETERDNDS